MKIFAQRPNSRKRSRAFTLAEMSVVVGVGVAVGNGDGAGKYVRAIDGRAAAGVDGRHGRLGANAGFHYERRAFGANLLVGNYVNNVFVPVPDNTNQWGDAVRIFYSNATNQPPWVDYYYYATNLYRTNYNGPGVAGSASRVTAQPGDE